MEAGIPLIDIKINENCSLQDGDSCISFVDCILYSKGQGIWQGSGTYARIILPRRWPSQSHNTQRLLSKFIDNTLAYAQREKHLIVDLEKHLKLELILKENMF